MRANAPQLPGGGWAQLELTDALTTIKLQGKLDCPPIASIRFYVNIRNFRLLYFQEFATDFPETSQVI